MPTVVGLQTECKHISGDTDVEVLTMCMCDTMTAAHLQFMWGHRRLSPEAARQCFSCDSFEGPSAEAAPRFRSAQSQGAPPPPPLNQVEEACRGMLEIMTGAIPALRTSTIAPRPFAMVVDMLGARAHLSQSTLQWHDPLA